MKYYNLFFFLAFSLTSTHAQNVVSGAIQSKVSINGSINENCATNHIVTNPLRFTLNQNNSPVLNFQPMNGSNTYEVPVGQGDYEVVPTVNFSDGFNVIPEQFEVSFASSSGEMVAQDICIEPRTETVDGINIKFYPYYYNPDPFVYRFDAYIDLENTNATSYAVDLRMVYDDNYSFVLDYDDSFPADDNNGEFEFNTFNISANSSARIYLRISYNSETHPNYPLLPGDELVYDLFLTSMENRNDQGGTPSFRLIQTIDAGEQTLDITNVENDLESSLLRIYPNPSNSVINIQNDHKINDIVMYSINGQLIQNVSFLQESSEWIQMDISKLDNGVYFLSIQTDTATLVKKVIKN